MSAGYKTTLPTLCLLTILKMHQLRTGLFVRTPLPGWVGFQKMASLDASH